MRPPNDEALTGGAVQGLKGQGEAEGCDSTSPSDDRKAFATLQAQFSLKGYTLLRLADGVLLAGRWGYLRQLDTLTHAAQFLSKIGGQP